MVNASLQRRCEQIALHFLGWREKAKIRRICTTRFLEFGANYLTSKDRSVNSITTVAEERTWSDRMHNAGSEAASLVLLAGSDQPNGN